MKRASTELYPQYITDDSYTPHVCGVTDGFIVDHFWGHELRGPKQNLQNPGVFCWTSESNT